MAGQNEVPGVGSLPGVWARTLMASTDVWLGALDLLLFCVAASASPTPLQTHSPSLGLLMASGPSSSSSISFLSKEELPYPHLNPLFSNWKTSLV